MPPELFNIPTLKQITKKIIQEALSFGRPGMFGANRGGFGGGFGGGGFGGGGFGGGFDGGLNNAPGFGRGGFGGGGFGGGSNTQSSPMPQQVGKEENLKQSPVQPQEPKSQAPTGPVSTPDHKAKDPEGNTIDAEQMASREKPGEERPPQATPLSKEEQAGLAAARRQMEAENEAMMRRELGDKKYNAAEQRKQEGDDLRRMNPEIASKSALAQSRRAADVVATNTQKEIEELDKNEEQLKAAGKSTYEISQMRKALVDKQRENQAQNVKYDEQGNIVTTMGADLADKYNSNPGTISKIGRDISDALGIERERETKQIRDAKSGYVPNEYRIPNKK